MMKYADLHEKAKELREKIPVGTKVRCLSMKEDPCPVPAGSIGTVTAIDDIATIHVDWGFSSLGLVYGEDEYEIVS